MEICAEEGLIVCPEGAATWEGLKKLGDIGKVHKDEKNLLINTGTGYKYL